MTGQAGDGHDHAGSDDAHAHQHGKGEAGQGHAHGEGGGHSHGGAFGERTELIFALGCGVALGVGWLMERAGAPHVSLTVFVAAYFLGGFNTAREAFENLKHKRFEIDTLMLVAAVGAAILGEWAEGALLLFLFSFSNVLQRYAMERTQRAIHSLLKLRPDKALVKRPGGATETVPVEALTLGDIVVVRPGVDGKGRWHRRDLPAPSWLALTTVRRAAGSVPVQS